MENEVFITNVEKLKELAEKVSDFLNGDRITYKRICWDIAEAESRLKKAMTDLKTISDQIIAKKEELKLVEAAKFSEIQNLEQEARMKIAEANKRMSDANKMIEETKKMRYIKEKELART